MKLFFLHLSFFVFVVTSCSQDTNETDTTISKNLNINLVKPDNFSSKTEEILTAVMPNIILKGTNIIFTGTASNTISVIQLSVDGFNLGSTVANSNVGIWSKTYNFSLAAANRQLTVKGLSSSGTVLITKTFKISVYNTLVPLVPSLVLMYHEITPTPNFNDDVSTTNFNQQMQWLKNNGYTTISTEDLYILQSLPQKSVILTFDDGYAGNYTNAKPILESLNLKADFFVHTDYVGTKSTTSWNKVTWDQLRIMDASPLFSVYSHTKNHLKLTEISPEQLATELIGSKQRLEMELGGLRNFLAYPLGDYNLNVINATQQAGYIMAYAVGNKGSFNKPLQYSVVRKGVGKNITTIQEFKTRIGVN